jgi:hypothetical protein
VSREGDEEATGGAVGACEVGGEGRAEGPYRALEGIYWVDGARRRVGRRGDLKRAKGSLISRVRCKASTRRRRWRS